MIKQIIYSSILACSVLLASCGGSKKAAVPDELPKPVISNKLEDYYKKNIQYNTFSAKANVDYKDAKQSQSIIVLAKMNKAKDLWLSASALGGIVNVGKGYATPDSLKAVVNLTNSAYALSYKDGIAMIKTDIDFISLQNMFIGNALIENGKIQEAKEENGQVVLLTTKDDYNLTIYYDKANAQIKKQVIENKKANFIATMLFNNYKPLADKQPFSHNRSIAIIRNGEQINVEIEFSKVEINIPLSISFNIPTNYKLNQF